MTEPSERALVASFAKRGGRGTAFGTFHFIVGIAALPASLLMGFLWKTLGPQLAFTIAGAIALGAVAILKFPATPSQRS